MTRDSNKDNQRFNWLNLIIGTSALIISVFSIISTERIAEKSGAFDKGNLDLSFGEYSLVENTDYEIYYGINFQEHAVNLVALPISIENNGKKSVEKVQLYHKYPFESNLMVENRFIDSDILINLYKRQTVRERPFNQTQIEVESLNPNISMPLGDIINLDETITFNNFPVTTKDSIELNMSTYMRYGIYIQVGLSGKDMTSKAYSFILEARKENNLNKLLRSIVSDKIANKGQRKAFFIVVPGDPEQLTINKIGKLNQYKSEEIFLFKFDENWKKVFMINSRLMVARTYDIKELL